MNEASDKHPNRRRIRWIVFSVIALLLLFWAKSHFGKHAPVKPAKTVPVTMSAARQGSIRSYLEALGVVTPLSTVTVRSRVDGQLMKVNFREGQTVRQGDLLVEIDPRPYEALLAQAEGQYQRDKALLDNAYIDLKRYEDAYAENAVSKQQLDTQRATVEGDKGIVRLDEGQLENAKTQLSYCYPTSPISGRVGLRLVDAGNLVHATDSSGLLVITRLEPITVVFSLAEDDVVLIEKRFHEKRHVMVRALDREGKTVIATGYLLSFDNQIDPTTGTIKLKAIFPNNKGSLFPSQFVNVKLLIDSREDVTLVPSAAVQRSGQGTFVYRIEDQTASMVSVKAGITEDDAVEVEGVDPGDEVATDGFDKLQDGAKISLPEKKSPHAKSGDKNPEAGR